MFNKPKNNPPQQAKSRSEVPVPPLPDLPSPGKSNDAPSDDTPQAAAAAPAQAAAPARGASVLAHDLVFEGNVSGDGALTVDGQVKGDIRVTRLVVGDSGSVEGSVHAENVEIRGRVVGAVSGQQVHLLSTAYVDGDITHEQLAIEVGAYFQGRAGRSAQEAAAPSGPSRAPAASPSQPASASAPASAAAPVVTPSLSNGATPPASAPAASSQGEVVNLKPSAS